jgi:hypothetical protein
MTLEFKPLERIVDDKDIEKGDIVMLRQVTCEEPARFNDQAVFFTDILSKETIELKNRVVRGLTGEKADYQPAVAHVGFCRRLNTYTAGTGEVFQHFSEEIDLPIVPVESEKHPEYAMKYEYALLMKERNMELLNK